MTLIVWKVSGVPFGVFLLVMTCSSAAPPQGPTAGNAISLAGVQLELDQLLELHSESPEAPTVVIAGHHNNGKSALLEALLGVRLSQVGAAVSTRRVLRVHAQHDVSAIDPVLFLEVCVAYFRTASPALARNPSPPPLDYRI